MTPQKAGAPTFADLPPAARAYVGAVVGSGALCLLDAATRLRFDHSPGLFALLIALGIVTSGIKIDLPLGRSQSNLSLSHAINFWALLALGPAHAVCIATVSAWTQVRFASAPATRCIGFSSTSDR